MRKLILIYFILLYFHNVKAQSYIYHPFPTSGVMWRESSQGYECCCSDSHIIITGDTIISSLLYHKLESSSVAYYNYTGGWCTTNVIFSGSGYLGAFRNDSINKKVYFIKPGYINDTLFYDFDLHVGDTLPVSLINDTLIFSSSAFNLISAIDSVLVGGSYHKQYWISTDSLGWGTTTNYVSIIEGVGTSFGLFGLMGGAITPTFEAGSTLLCQTVNGLKTYPDDGGVSDCLPVMIGITNIPKIKIMELYPNPTMGKFKMEFSKMEEYTIEIINIYGENIREIHFNDISVELDISDNSKGIYFLKLSDRKGNTSVKKIVKK